LVLSSTRSAVRPVVPDVMWYLTASSRSTVVSVPNGGASSCASIHSSRVMNGMRLMSSTDFS
jgi:hypothetical protein